ncbi:NADH-ubiquinone oxidoreductase chain G [hydrothermal vent metagenome]|uniref:NADH-ubiquinone oxidoreductase chain G n=1 Tax=hydrothermal vent metagenome TaxID=652676 RepID=A0A3B0RD25_9ZZZZ
MEAASDKLALEIDGKEVSVRFGTLILDAAKEVGITIPTFCYQARLSGIGSCRMCIVEIEGQKKLQPACITPVMDGMKIATNSDTVVSARKSMLEFLLSNHAKDCPICDKAGECELQDMVYSHGQKDSKYEETKVRHHEKDYIISPVIVKNSNRCVQCVRCVRVCREVVGRGVLGSVGRGAHQEETSFRKGDLDCDSCGMCIEVCPVGCFMRLPYRYKARPWDLKSAVTVCPYCATGCKTTIQERDGEVLRSIAFKDQGFNDRMMCARGRFGYDILNSDKRLTKPLKRKGDGFEEISWSEAFGMISSKFARTAPQKRGGVASASLTNEELFFFQKVMRQAVGTPNLDSTSRWSGDAAGAFIAATALNEGGRTIYQAVSSDTVLVIGSQLSEENPVIDYIVRHVTDSGRSNLVIASPRSMKLDATAHQSIRHIPGEIAKFLNALILCLYEDNPGRFASLEGAGISSAVSISELATLSGVTEDELRQLSARLKRSETVSILAGTDILRLGQGARGLRLLKLALEAMGKRLRILPILDRANQRGAWGMGVHPSLGPGFSPLTQDGERGLDCYGMLSAAAEGDMEFMYVVGEDIAGMHPDRGFAEAALSKVGFLVVQDTFMTDTALRADLILPGALAGEKSGTFTNQVGRVQNLNPIQSPPGDARIDLRIMEDLASSVSPGFMENACKDIFGCIQKVVPSYINIDNKSTGKDCGSVIPTDVSFEAFFNVAESPGAVPTAEYPLRLITGNHLFYSGNLSSYSDILCGLLKEPTAEVGPETAEALGLCDGQNVNVACEGYLDSFRLKISKGTPAGVVFIAENYADKPVNRFFRRGESIPRVKITS